MSKKNSSANLKNQFKSYKDLALIFSNFQKRLNLLNKKKYLVAVSGGPDSLALVALTKVYGYSNNAKFHYVLIDHGIRKNSNKEAKKVKNLLKKSKIDLKIIKNKKKIFRNIQAEARNIRYELISNYCKKNNIKTILTAHNLEDQVETFLIRLSRGSGLKGLSSMKFLNKLKGQINLFRPLLDVKKKYLIKISKKIFGKYFIDPANKDSKFLRTKIRNLKTHIENSGIKYEQIFKSIQNLSFSKDTLEEYLKRIFERIIKKKKGEVIVNFKKYTLLNNDTKLAVLNESIKQLKKNYYDLRSRKVKNLIKIIDEKDFTRATLGGCIFFKKNGNLCLIPEKI